MPLLHLLAGPNGAGKSSYIRDVLGPVTRLPLVDADTIAAERWPEAQAEHAYEAAAIQLADVTDVLDNSSARTPFRPCARYEHGRLIGHPVWPSWTPLALRKGEHPGR